MAETCRTDGDLLRAFAVRDDDAAFEELVRRHSELVRRVARRVCRSDDAAEDVVQQVFLTLTQRCVELCGRVSLAGWIYNTTLHVALRHRRNATLRQRHERQAAEQRERAAAGTNRTYADWADPAHKPAGLLPESDSDQSDRLRRALAALPEIYRDALILHHIEGYTVEQTATLLAANPGTVAARLSRGRAILRERLGAMGVGAGVGLGITIDQEMAWAVDEEYLLVGVNGSSRVPPALGAPSVSAPVSSALTGGTAVVVKKFNMAAACALLGCGALGAAGSLWAAGGTPAVSEARISETKQNNQQPSSNWGWSGERRPASAPEPGAISLVGLAAAALLRRPATASRPRTPPRNPSPLP